MSDQPTQHTTVQGPVDLDEAQKLCDAIKKNRTVEAIGSYSTHLDARLVDVAAALELLPRLVAGVRECRSQRDENLANVRRIDDLRIADTARLQRKLDIAEADNERLRLFEAQADQHCERLEEQLCGPIAEQFPNGPYPDGDVQGTVRQAGLLAGLEQVAYLIAKQAAELRFAREAGSFLLSAYDIDCAYCEHKQAEQVLSHLESPRQVAACNACAASLRSTGEGA